MFSNKDGKKFEQKCRQMWQFQLILLGSLSLLFPGGANAASVLEEKLPDRPFPQTTISLNFFDLFRNAIRFVQVSNISNAEEVEIGKQINQRLLSEQYKLHNNDRTQ